MGNINPIIRLLHGSTIRNQSIQLLVLPCMGGSTTSCRPYCYQIVTLSGDQNKVCKYMARQSLLLMAYFRKPNRQKIFFFLFRHLTFTVWLLCILQKCCSFDECLGLHPEVMQGIVHAQCSTVMHPCSTAVYSLALFNGDTPIPAYAYSCIVDTYLQNNGAKSFKPGLLAQKGCVLCRLEFENLIKLTLYSNTTCPCVSW